MMIRTLLILFLSAFACFGQTNISVIYSFVNGLGQTQTVKQVSFTPLYLAANGKAYVTGEEVKRVITTPQYTNPMLSGLAYLVKYYSSIQPPTVSLQFTNSFPTNVSGVVYAVDCTAISTNLGNGIYAYSRAQADARFVYAIVEGTNNALSNGTLTLKTNYFSGTGSGISASDATNIATAIVSPYTNQVTPASVAAAGAVTNGGTYTTAGIYNIYGQVVMSTSGQYYCPSLYTNNSFINSSGAIKWLSSSGYTGTFMNSLAGSIGFANGTQFADTNGNVTATSYSDPTGQLPPATSIVTNNSIATLKRLTLSDTNSFTFYAGGIPITGGGSTANDEMVLAGSTGNNLLALMNTNPAGFSAITARDNNGYEHAAWGYGNTNGIAFTAGKVYWEAFSGGSGKPPEMVMNQDGDYGGGFGFYKKLSFDTNGNFHIWQRYNSADAQYSAYDIDLTNAVHTFAGAINVTTKDNASLYLSVTNNSTTLTTILLTAPSVSGYGEIDFKDSNHALVGREGGTNTFTFYEYGQTLANGGSYRFMSGGLRASQSNVLLIGNDGVAITGTATVNGATVLTSGSGLNAANLTNTIPNSTLSTNVPLLTNQVLGSVAFWNGTQWKPSSSLLWSNMNLLVLSNGVVTASITTNGTVTATSFVGTLGASNVNGTVASATTATTVSNNATVSGLTNTGTFTTAMVAGSGTTPTITSTSTNFGVFSITGTDMRHKVTFSVTNTAPTSTTYKIATVAYSQTYPNALMPMLTTANTNAVYILGAYMYLGVDAMTSSNYVIIARSFAATPVSANTTNAQFIIGTGL